MRSVNPYLNFPGTTEEAFEFYRSVFGGEFSGLTRYRDFPDNGMGVPEPMLDKIANIALPLGAETVLMGTDVIEGQGPLVVGNNVYIHLEVDAAEEASRVFDRLSSGGTTFMPVQRTEWAEKYGICADRFSVLWMVMYTGDVQFAPGAAAETGTNP
jgi:PhnB protein